MELAPSVSPHWQLRFAAVDVSPLVVAVAVEAAVVVEFVSALVDVVEVVVVVEFVSVLPFEASSDVPLQSGSAFASAPRLAVSSGSLAPP